MTFRPHRPSAAELLLAALVLTCSAIGCAQRTTKPSGGGACSSDGDCGSGFECRNRICTEVSALCSPGRRTCDGSTVVVCSADGLGFSQKEVCQSACANGICVVPKCTQGDKQCAGNIVTTCTDGVFKPTEICANECQDNACTANRCQPGSRWCEDTRTLKTCDRFGSSSDATICNGSGPGHCVANAGNLGSFCSSDLCVPGVQRCDGLMVVRCNSDGAGETPLTLCSSGCNQGVCVAPVCAAGTRRCSADGLSVERCNDAGTAWNTQDCTADGEGLCAVTETAEGVRAVQCVAPICTPGVKVCRGDKLIQCSEDGLSESAQTCSFGCDPTTAACKAAACVAGAQQCACSSDPHQQCSATLPANTRQICAEDRRSYIALEYCLAGCTASGGTTHCNPLMCSPFDGRCTTDGLSFQTCKADGSGWTTTACDSGKVCESGTCVTPTPSCADGSRRCVDGSVQLCARDGSGETDYRTIAQCIAACDGNGCDASGGCSPFALTLSPGQGTLVADGNSTYRIVSSTIVGPDGAAVPDGTVVNIWVDGASVISADGNSVLPGIQVPAIAGKVQTVVKAPALAGAATVIARVQNFSSCAGSLSLTFGTPSP